jgi:transposase-like protein
VPRPRRWTDDELAAAVAASSTLSEVHRRLGLRAGGYDSMRAHIARLGLDAAHIPRAVAGDTRVRRNWTDEDLRRAVADAVSVHDVLRRLGRTPSGGMFRSIVAHIHRLEHAPPVDRGRPEAAPLRGVRSLGVARAAAPPPPRPRQRRPHRQPVGEPPYPLSQLPLPHGDVVSSQGTAGVLQSAERRRLERRQCGFESRRRHVPRQTGTDAGRRAARTAPAAPTSPHTTDTARSTGCGVPPMAASPSTTTATVPGRMPITVPST